VTGKGEELRAPLTEIRRWGARWEGAKTPALHEIA
jgi:DNA-binding HxlR family transcriptional regulator